MKKYRYCYAGSFDCKKTKFFCSIPIPVDYESKEDVKSEPSYTLQFEVEDEHIVLKIYSEDKVVSTIRCNEQEKYSVSMFKVYPTGEYLLAGDKEFPEYDVEIKRGLDWDKLFDIKTLTSEWKSVIHREAYDIYPVNVA